MRHRIRKVWLRKMLLRKMMMIRKLTKNQKIETSKALAEKLKTAPHLFFTGFQGMKDSEKKARAERALEELQKRFENGNSQHSGGGPGFARGLRSSTRPGLRASGGWSSEARTLD